MYLRSALFFLIFSACASQKQFKSGLIPPGTVRVNDTLFIDKTEVTNIGWREYLYYLISIKKDTIAYQMALPDTLVWSSPDRYDPISEYYFAHPGFNSYPVVGISYEQAVEFCKWRTYAANQQVYFKEKNIKAPQSHLNDTFRITFFYRLPTKGEWEKIAAGKYSVADHPYGYPDIYAKWKGKKQKAFNCEYQSLERTPDTTRVFYTAPTTSYFKNSTGAYCMIGNIAEMIAEKGIAKGGSFIHPVDSCKIVFDQLYSEPNRWLGFRCVAVLLK